jgi:hypothetical protein
MAGAHPWMPWWVFDWLEDRAVKRMHRIARSMYFDLLCHEWIGGPLPDDVRECAELLGELPRSVAPHWLSIRERFDLQSSSKLAHSKLESLRNQARIKSEKSSNAAKERWARDTTALPTPNAQAMPSESESKHSKTDTEETLVASPPATLKVQFDFVSVYAAYPRKEGRTRGIARLRSQVRTPEAFDDLKQAVANFAEKHRVEGTEAKFIPHFSTWVSTWRDYIDGPHIVAIDGPRQYKNFRPPRPHIAETYDEDLDALMDGKK